MLDRQSEAQTNALSINHPIIAFGEAMIEVSNIEGCHADLGVAGDTFNTAVYLARSGTDVSFATAVGDDQFSQRVISAIEAEGIDTAYVRQFSERTVGLYAVAVNDEGERSFTYWRSESAARDALNGKQGESFAEKIANAGVLYVSGITLSMLGEEGRQRLNEIAIEIRRRGGDIAFDTNYRVKGWGSAKQARAAIEALQPFITLALPTFEDDRDLFGDGSAEMTASRWANCGVGEVVVKSGPKGAYLHEHGWIPPNQVVQPIDTTGAGDSFNGAYLSARLNGSTPQDAVRKAHSVAQQVLMTHGAILPRV